MRGVLPMLMAMSLLLQACGDEPLTFASYNAGFATGFVRSTAERVPVTSAAIADLDADVVCLQEVWLPEQVDAMADAAADAFPHQFFPEPQQEEGDGPACASDTYLFQCAREQCPGSCSDDLVDCVLDHCGFSLLGLDQTCQNCVMANVGGSIDEIEQACLEGDQHYAYGGSFGTGILSKLPLGPVEELVMDSTTNRRSVLHATATPDDGSGDFDLYCTHLSAVFGPTIPYPRETGSWSEEQQGQATTMLAWMDEQDATDRRVLLGDLNSGPATADAVAVEPDTWAIVEGGGMTDAFTELDGSCTYCPENPICAEYPDGDGELIDHVLLAGFEGAMSARRILDDAITVDSCGTAIDAAYSDHYGVAVTVGL